MNINNFLIFFIVALFYNVQAQESTNYTLDEAVQYGLLNSPQMRLTEAEIATAEAQIMEYKSIGIPKVNASGAYTYYFAIPTQILPDFLSPAVDGRLLTYNLIEPGQVIPPATGGVPAQFGTRNILNLGIEANFLLFDPAFFAGLKAIKNTRVLALRQQDLQRFNLKSNITKAYLSLAYNYEVKKSLTSDLEIARKSLNEAKLFFDSGFLEDLDIQRLEFTVAVLETEFEKMNQFIKLSENLLKFQMNFPMNKSLAISNTWQELMERFATLSLEAESNPKSDRPEIKILETTSLLRKLQIESTKAGYYPTIRGFAIYNGQLLRNNLFDSDENPWFPASFAGLNLSVPIFDGHLKKSQIRNQRIELAKIGYQREQLESAIQMEVNNAQLTLQNALKTLSNQQKNKTLADNIYKTAKIKFKEGIGSSLELTQAEGDLFRAQSALLEANFSLLNARFELLKALGKL